MADKPIIFSGPMVRALLDGRKTQTRRVMNPQPRGIKSARTFGPGWAIAPESNRCTVEFKAPAFASGDRLYVREAWRPHYLGDGVWNIDVSYPADGERRRINDGEFGDRDWNWPKAADRGNVTPLHMPRWASRLTLTVTEVRVQRLQEISAYDVQAEGACELACLPPVEEDEIEARSIFRDLWNSLHGADAWDANPWVVALTFTVQHGNIDQFGKA